MIFSASSVFALPDPQVAVESVVNSVLAVLQRTDIDNRQKKALISMRVQKFMNIESMAALTLGSYWDSASSEQRQLFSDLFIEVLEGTYLNRINAYSDGRVDYLSQRVKEDKAIVDTVIVAKDINISVQYKMIYRAGTWQVLDLVVENVSLIRNYNSSYSEIIRRDGFDGLLVLMQKKITEMAQR